ncbi:O-antigen ligase family protein [Streptomyces sp. NPDC006678]|uniref:O-antigen ligase family protein n=1 Tax=Streptomyces sp. NPDC006678 TaxID=3157185 RepID=UPI0033F9CF35
MAAAADRSAARERSITAGLGHRDEPGDLREHGGAPDAAGVILLGCCAAWALISAAGREARPEGVLLAVLAVAAGYACGRICGSLLPVAGTAVAAAGALALAVAEQHGAVTGLGPAPSGHAGSAAALLVLSAGAACCAAAAVRPPAARLLLWLTAVAAAGTALAWGSASGFVAATGVVLCALAAGRTHRRLPALAGFAVAAALVAGASWAMAVDALPRWFTGPFEDRLGADRMLLWQDAADLARAHPVLGAGPDRFGELSPAAQLSLVPDGSPHSAALQQAAEQGLVGVLLLGALYCWMLYGLWRSPRPTPVVLSAGAALTALAALATLGDALSLTPVTAGAGLLAGLAMARPAPESSAPAMT